MAIVLITGVPGTGKTAYVVSELEKIAATGRKIFVDNIPDLKVEHYRAGNVLDWHKGSWLHIDNYKRTSPAVALAGDSDGDSGNENWLPHPDVVKDKDGSLRLLVHGAQPPLIGSVPYESHKGALLVIDEAQRHFRPRPAGSVVPDHVAALEVHRHQGLDIWLITQRAGLVDANVRALCGKHIALRQTPLGRYKYEWPEVGDIESKSSRDNAARSRYKLPSHVFGLYKSAEAHVKHKIALPMAAKILMIALPAVAFFGWQSYSMISSKFRPAVPVAAMDLPAPILSLKPIKNAAYAPGDIVDTRSPVPSGGFEPNDRKAISNEHPFQNSSFRITARLTSATRDMFAFAVSSNGGSSSYLSSMDLVKAGYSVIAVNDCSVKLVYKAVEFFVTCVDAAVRPIQYQPVNLAQR